MKQYDLTDCDLEPIHLIGRVQPHAALLAFDNSWTITHASQSLADYLGEAPEEVIGRSLVSVLPHELVHDLRTKLQLANGSELVLGLRDVALNGQRFDLAISNTAGKTVLDIERHSGTVPDGELNLISSIAERVPDGVPVPQMTQAIARAFRALTGYDRTMVYRFAEDGSGEVIAEATAPGVEPYLGLRYPDTDIPAQARALLLRNRVRLIADSADPGVPIMGLGDLDLSLSGIRAVSPIHLEYLRNMGVASSMTVSLIVGGRLWGLVACHHRKPFVVPMATRGAADLLGRLLAHKIGLRLAEEELEAISRTGSLQKTLLTHDGGGASVADNLPFIARSVAGDIAFDSIAFLHDGHLELAGEPLPRRQAEAAMRQLQPLVGSEIWHTDKLAHFLPNLPLAGMAGAMALPLAEGQLFVLFRREIAETIRWAGAPTKPDIVTGRLHPRDSFSAWLEERRGHSAPWTARDRKLADGLRTALLELSLRGKEHLRASLKRASDSQELLISELNHRVRNVFALVRGVVNQSHSETRDPQDTLRIVLNRINALARAHDQLTRAENTALSDLVRVESRAFATRGASRLSLVGPDHWIRPEAAPTIALVLHELVTNAVKHGSLGAKGGTATLSVTVLPGGALRLDWQEIGGPEVRHTGRRGFGSAIIERSVPFELGGQAEVIHDPAGLRACFVLPAHLVSARDTSEAEPAPESPRESQPLAAVGRLLLVEDNMLIAMDVADSLRSLGAQHVAIAGSLREAAALIDEAMPDLAILDINLSGETSLSLAQHLAGAGCPLILATGYSTNTAALADYPNVPVLQKPYDTDALAEAIARAFRPGS